MPVAVLLNVKDVLDLLAFKYLAN